MAELWRYYKIGIVNSAFGYGLYALLIFLHLNIYLAQILSHVTGMGFNYFMLSIHVFIGSKPKLFRYIFAYGVNYLMGLLFLTVYHMIIASPYIVGFLTLFTTAFLNYFILKRFVFRVRGPES